MIKGGAKVQIGAMLLCKGAKVKLGVGVEVAAESRSGL